MDTRLYPAVVSVLLNPVINNRAPTCRVGVNGQLQDISLATEQWFDFNVTGPIDSVIKLEIEHYGKTDNETNTVTGADVAVIVEAIKLNNITSQKFIWAGVYRPNYPPHLSSNSAELAYTNYLGWNGVWSLDFTLPIYTWIHTIEDLGWIYD